MKNLTTLGFLLFISFCFAQETADNFSQSARNELSINLPLTIFAEFPSISYERLLNSELGAGVSAGVGLNSDDIRLNYSLIPFVRWYFLENNPDRGLFGRRFFIEANGGLIGYEAEEYHPHSENVTEKSTMLPGLGMGIGYKYVNESNWMGSLYLGGGKIFGANNEENYRTLEAYPHIGINIGKRF